MISEQRLATGMKIKKWRSFKDFKQDSFAKEIGISRIMLSRYENGRSRVSIETLQKMAMLLEIEITTLL